MAEAVAGSRSRRTFAPTVLVGLLGAVLVAVGGHKTMLAIPGSYLASLKSIAPTAGLQADDGVDFPLAGALGLVALAGWGVLLVSRGTFRRVVAVVTVLAGAGVLAVLVVGGFVQRDDAARDLTDRLGVSATVPLHPSGWFWVCLVGSVLTLAAALAAVRMVPGWPEMGSKYDAPGADPDAGTAPTAAPEDQSNLELWKSLDEGHDPTV